MAPKYELFWMKIQKLLVVDCIHLMSKMRFDTKIQFNSCEPTDLFYLQTEAMEWATFEWMTGCDLWSR